jgi:hypothetical protein
MGFPSLVGYLTSHFDCCRGTVAMFVLLPSRIAPSGKREKNPPARPFAGTRPHCIINRDLKASDFGLDSESQPFFFREIPVLPWTISSPRPPMTGRLRGATLTPRKRSAATAMPDDGLLASVDQPASVRIFANDLLAGIPRRHHVAQQVANNERPKTTKLYDRVRPDRPRRKRKNQDLNINAFGVVRRKNASGVFGNTSKGQWHRRRVG